MTTIYNTTVQGGPDTTDPRTIDWAERRIRAVVPFGLDDEGMPVNPMCPDLPAGRGELWHWGEAVATDAMVISWATDDSAHILMVDRDDDYGWALPGGMLDPGENPLEAMLRELREETGLRVPRHLVHMRPGRYVADPRAARHAWMVTVPGRVILLQETPPAVEGRDDARRAEWLPADSYAALEAAVANRGGRVFAAHVDMLRTELG